jgi:nitrate reductase gamma subunit
MMTPMDFLLLVRGPLFVVAVAIFMLGFGIRLVEILMLGRARNFAEPRGSAMLGGFRTVYRRFSPDPGTFERAPFDVVIGILWHVGFILALFLFIPHVELIRKTFGIAWPALPNPMIDAITVITLLALFAALVQRLRDPVKRFLSTPQDYLVWTLTFLPLLTGYLAYHRMINPYPLILGLHILSVEIFLIVAPFTKLTHMVTAFVARWYNGATFGRKGVQS